MIGLVPLYLVRWRMNVITLPEEEAKALGVDTHRLRLMVVTAATPGHGRGLHQGRLVRTGQPEVVITRDSLRAIYDVDVDIVQVHREGYETRACIPVLAPRAGLTRVANRTAVRSGSSGDATAF